MKSALDGQVDDLMKKILMTQKWGENATEHKCWMRPLRMGTRPSAKRKGGL